MCVFYDARSMWICQLLWHFPILLDAATAAVARKGDKFLARWADIMTGMRHVFSSCEYQVIKYIKSVFNVGILFAPCLLRS